MKSYRRVERTPVVKPGDPLQLGMDVYREKNCPITVRRLITFSTGARLPITQEIDPNYGPIGRDQYTLLVPISAGSPKGDAEMWSKACSRCNILQDMHQSFEVCGRDVVDKFRIGDETILKPWPEDFKPSKDMIADPEQSGR